jgi:hypothetical protein
MAEQEIAKHTKKVYKIWSSKEHSWKHKLKEFLIEIFIIVFAVTLSIWLHNLSEKKHAREEVKNFFTGLKSDMEKDVAEMRNDSAFYKKQILFFTLLASQNPGTVIDTAFLSANTVIFHTSAYLKPNISRFDALKYSGLMEKIKNKDLLDEILNLYEENIPTLVEKGKSASDYKSKNIADHIDAVYYGGDTDYSKLQDLVEHDKQFVFNLKKNVRSMQLVYEEYGKVIIQYQKVIDMIADELK